MIEADDRPTFITVPIVIYKSTEHEWETGSEEPAYQAIRLDSIVSWWPTDRERGSWPDLRCTHIEYEGGTVIADVEYGDFTEQMEAYGYEMESIGEHHEPQPA